MGKVFIDIPKIVKFAQAECRNGMLLAAQKIAAEARSQTPTGKRIKSVSAGGGSYQFFARSKNGRKLKIAKVVTIKRKASDWERRFPGQLKKSIRVVEKEGKENNVRVYMGHYFAYYAGWVERGTYRTKAFNILKNASNDNNSFVKKTMTAAMGTACIRANAAGHSGIEFKPGTSVPGMRPGTTIHYGM